MLYLHLLSIRVYHLYKLFLPIFRANSKYLQIIRLLYIRSIDRLLMKIPKEFNHFLHMHTILIRILYIRSQKLFQYHMQIMFILYILLVLIHLIPQYFQKEFNIRSKQNIISDYRYYRICIQGHQHCYLYMHRFLYLPDIRIYQIILFFLYNLHSKHTIMYPYYQKKVRIVEYLFRIRILFKVLH